MTKKMRVLLIIVSVLAAIFMSLSTSIGDFFFTSCANAQTGVIRPPRVPEPFLFSVLALVGAYFFSKSGRR